MSTLGLTIVVILLTFAAVIAVGFALTRRTAQAKRSVAAAAMPAIVPAAAPVYVPSSNGTAGDRTAPVHTPHTPAITWPSLIDEGISDLPIDERRALVSRLAVVNDEWTLPILRRAVHEERDPQILDAIVDALIARH